MGRPDLGWCGVTLQIVPDAPPSPVVEMSLWAAVEAAGVPREHRAAACQGFADWLGQHTRNGSEHIAALRDAAYPFNAGTVDRQTEQARRWAVQLEQENAELIRRHAVALALLDEAGCSCSHPNPGLAVLTCIRHQVEDVLRSGSLA